MDLDNNLFYFVGVSTKHSAVHRMFPKWCEILGVNAKLVGIDLQLNSPRLRYVDLLNNMKKTLCVGGLVTSHKTAIVRFGREHFSYISPIAKSLGEVSAIYKDWSSGMLCGEAVDAFSIIPSAKKMTAENKLWLEGDQYVIIFGGGGAGLALTYALCHMSTPPKMVSVIEQCPKRVSFLCKLIKNENLFPGNKVRVHPVRNFLRGFVNFGHNPLVVNATGMGKDYPGTPVDPQNLPNGSTIWDFNYRGDLQLLEEGKRIQEEKGFQIHDGWEYFINGWMNVMCIVFHKKPCLSYQKQFKLAALE